MHASQFRGRRGRVRFVVLSLCGVMALGLFFWRAETSPVAVDEGYQSVASVTDRETYAAMRPDHRQMLANIVERTVKGLPPETYACWAPGSNNSGTVEAFNAALTGGLALLGGDFQLGARWSSTATDGSGLGQGDPMTLRYSFVPDGTNIPSSGTGASGPSQLFSWLNGIYGSPAVWQAIFAEEFDRWGELTGITYVFESNDDGASFPGTSGAIGQRGDVRIAARTIDGTSNVLAFNFFPSSGGDMVLDSADGFYNNVGNDSRRLRNVVAHEHGHGLGLAHVCPNNGQKLMEPFINTNFLGAQNDDIQGAQRHYGDRFEDNDNAAQATNLGSLPDGTFTLENLSTDDNSDQDWFQFSAFGQKRISLTLRPIGLTYLAGPQQDPCSTVNSSYDSLNVSDLSLDLVGTDGSTVLTTSNTGGLGQNESITNFTLPGSGNFYFRVTPDAANSIQRYELDVTLETVGPPPFTVTYPTGLPTVVPAGQSTSVTVRATPLLGSLADPNNATLFTSVDGAPFVSSPLVPISATDFEAVLPQLDCFETVRWYVIITNLNGIGQIAPNGAPAIVNSTRGDGGNLTNFFSDTFVTNTGWTVVNDPSLTDGAWNRGVPVGGGTRGDPPTGFDADNFCFLTDNVAGNSDVDGGPTILLSPVFDMSAELDGLVSYAFWYDNDFGGNPNSDTFKVEVTDDGVNWERIETYNASVDSWVQREFRLRDYISMTANVQFRFLVDDVGGGSVVEAGLDAFSIDVCERSVFGPCGGGLVGLFTGGPYDVLTINGSAGGITRVVNNPLGQPITFEMAAPPGSASVPQFAITGISGIPNPGNEFFIGFFQGTLCFTPCLANPTDPSLFMLADNLTGNPTCPPLLPSAPAPWQFTTPAGFNFPFTISLQGVIVDSNDFRVTNAIALVNG